MLAVFADRPLPFLVVLAGAVAVLVGLLAADGNIRATQSLLAMAATAISLGITRGVVCGDRSEQRWFVLFQRGDPPFIHYARVLLLTIMAVALLLAIPTIALAITANFPTAFVAFAGALVWAMVCIAVATGVSSLVRRYDLESTLILVVLSLAQGYVFGLLQLSPSASTASSYLLLPVDGVFMLWDGVLYHGSLPSVPRLLHTLLYPLVWLGVAALRIGRSGPALWDGESGPAA